MGSQRFSAASGPLILTLRIFRTCQVSRAQCGVDTRVISFCTGLVCGTCTCTCGRMTESLWWSVFFLHTHTVLVLIRPACTQRAVTLSSSWPGESRRADPCRWRQSSRRPRMPDWSVGSTRRRPEADRLNIETASKQRRGGNGKGLQIRFCT